MESELCREVLRKMSALSVERPLREAERIDLVVAARALDAEDLRAITRIAGDPRSRATTWRTSLTAAAPGLEAIPGLRAVGASSRPAGESVLVYGVDIPAAAWLADRMPARVALVVNADLPCQLLDRVRELSDQGRAPIAILFSRAELRSSLPIAGGLLEEWLAGAEVR
jgi:hypothetical protein